MDDVRPMASAPRVILRDSTLREGLDTPAVQFSPSQRFHLGELLAEAGVDEAEVVAPSRVTADLEIARALKARGLPLRICGLVYADGSRYEQEIGLSAGQLDWVTLLMPLSSKREPADPSEKITRLAAAVDYAVARTAAVGVGFPHATQTDLELLVRIGRVATEHGARRITIYDTNGSADPFRIRELLTALRGAWDVEMFFHGHNDLGLATANSLAAVAGGAHGVEVTVNGLGDRAGNASLEQVAVGLHLRGMPAAVRLERLPTLSRVVEEASGVAVPKLAPIVGEYVFIHKSPAHLRTPELFEAFDPALIGTRRRLDH